MLSLIAFDVLDGTRQQALQLDGATG